MIKNGNESMGSIKNNIPILTILGIVFGIVYFFHSVLSPFAMALVLAYVLEPIAGGMNKYLKIPRSLASFSAIIIMILLIAIIISALLPTIYSQLIHLNKDIFKQQQIINIQNFSVIMEKLEQIAPGITTNVKQSFHNVVGNLISLSSTISGELLKSSTAAFSLIWSIIIIPVITYYALKNWPTILSTCKDLIPHKHRNYILNIAGDMDITVSNWLRGQLLVCIIMSIFYTILLTLTGLKANIALGVLSGILTFIPYAGAILSSILCITIAILQFADWNSVISVILAFIGAQIFEGMLLTPNIMGNKIGLHPVWILLGLLVCSNLMGFIGVIFAVPLTAVTAVLIRLAIAGYKQTELYTT